MAAAALAIGAGVQAYGSYTKSMEQSAAYGVQAQQKRATAAEVQIGADREIQLTQQAFERSRGAQLSAFSKSGVSMSTGSPLAVLEQSASNAFDQISALQHAADYRKGTLYQDAQQSDILGSQAKDAAFLSVLGAGASAFSKNPYSYDSRVKDSGGSILTNGDKAGGYNGPSSDTGIDAADYDPANYARLHYMGGKNL